MKGGDNMNDVYDCSQCRGPEIPSCEECEFNQGIENSSGRIDGPCGQQHCWHGCVVCRYNGGCYYNP